ncbi:MAG: hypothetical protein HZC47_10545 [Methanobacterium sp.]|uniref:hypothetical protein n=1 Tax=Methanobacterium sp. TaxID=2164 RepID=UPI003D64FCB8|nr:hypothetical protein [Methanobacterium sp.]
MVDLSENPVNWWHIVNKISYDKSTWDYLEPAEIVEILQRVTEAKEKIKGLDQYVRIHLSPAFNKLQVLMGPEHEMNAK